MRLIDADALAVSISKYSFYHENDRDMVWEIIRVQPTIEPESKPIEYQDCADALLKMWMDNVLTDGEYCKIICKLNAHQLEVRMRKERNRDERKSR